MLTLYLVCLILGGTLVVLSLFAGGEFDVDVDAEVPVDAEVDTGAQGGDGLEVAARFLTLRNATFFAAFFGLTGSLLTLLGIGAVLTPVFAVGSGLVAAVAIHRLMEHLARGEVGELPDPGALEGAMAEVLVPIDDEHKGKVAVKGGGRTLQLVAGIHRQADTRRFRVGDEVVIVDVDDGIAMVAGNAFLA